MMPEERMKSKSYFSYSRSSVVKTPPPLQQATTPSTPCPTQTTFLYYQVKSPPVQAQDYSVAGDSEQSEPLDNQVDCDKSWSCGALWSGCPLPAVGCHHLLEQPKSVKHANDPPMNGI
nr:homeobox protein OTX2-B-like isoform X1 [Biomphalaria glabrata]